MEQSFKGKNIFITGSTGFKGSWLSQWLYDLGANVTGFSLKPDTTPSLFESLGLEKKINQIYGDINDLKTLKYELAKANPEIVFHLAAQPIVSISYEEPVSTFQTNVMGTVNVLESIRTATTVKAVIVVSSDKCYQNNNWPYGYRETDAMGGYDPYSASKGCVELVVASYRNSFFNPINYGLTHKVAIASARAGNVIGGGDWANERLIPDCIKAINENEMISLRNPYATRPWQHVLDALYGYLTLASALLKDGVKFSEAWNFGPSTQSIHTVEEMVNKIILSFGKGEYKVIDMKVYHEASSLKLDISKAVSMLKWEPVLNTDDAIRMTADWYKKFYEQKDGIVDFTSEQITAFTKKTKRK